MNIRSSGILLHPTCLPTAYGIGDLGPAAYRFVDFLAATGQSLWQILPLTPTDPKHNNSPYHSTSALAGNPLLISPEVLVKEGLLANSDLADVPSCSGNRVDFEAVDAWYAFLGRNDIRMKTEPRTHRDGARSFYCYDPDGNTVQMICHPPVLAWEAGRG